MARRVSSQIECDESSIIIYLFSVNEHHDIKCYNNVNVLRAHIAFNGKNDEDACATALRKKGKEKGKAHLLFVFHCCVCFCLLKKFGTENALL